MLISFFGAGPIMKAASEGVVAASLFWRIVGFDVTGWLLIPCLTPGRGMTH